MIQQALRKLKITELNQMQHAALDAAKTGDVLLLSPTGSGKTLAFLLPLLSLLDADVSAVQALVLVPSRELALQIEQVFKAIGSGFKVNVCYGGHPVKTELNNLSQPPAVLIGTPGRIAFHVQRENFAVDAVKTLILDEFDKSLEFGFQEDMSYIIRQLPNINKRILTSATKMDAIPAFTGINNPTEINFLHDAANIPDLNIKAVITRPADKLDSLFSLLCQIGDKATLVFCNHREAVEHISELLWNRGLGHDIFHGKMEQDDRERALIKFRNGSHRVLITTDLAARGLDIPEIENIVHYQLPHNKDAFVHRNGRTARMKASGTAWLILTEDEKPAYIVDSIETVEVSANADLPNPSPWVTVYIGAGKKDKINKVDIVGLLLQKGGLAKDELGLIEVQDYASYAAVKRSHAQQMLSKLKNEKIKNKKVKIEISI
jgi:ATP-independent RNA helicase DbpA